MRRKKEKERKEKQHLGISIYLATQEWKALSQPKETLVSRDKNKCAREMENIGYGIFSESTYVHENKELLFFNMKPRIFGEREKKQMIERDLPLQILNILEMSKILCFTPAFFSREPFNHVIFSPS